MISETAVQSVLLPLATFGAMPRWVLQKLPPWSSASDRTLRRCLARLKHAKFIAAQYPHSILLKAAKPVPIWHLTAEGRGLLAAHVDPKYARGATSPPPSLVEHYLGIVDLHVDTGLAFAAQSAYELVSWTSEW